MNDIFPAIYGLIVSALLIVTINYEGDNSREIMLKAGEANNRYAYRHFQLIRLNFEKTWEEDFRKGAEENLKLAQEAEKARDEAIVLDDRYDRVVNLLAISLAVLSLYALFRVYIILIASMGLGIFGLIDFILLRWQEITYLINFLTPL
jgi:hypothetical protein